jgi:hypothetical protein
MSASGESAAWVGMALFFGGVLLIFGAGVAVGKWVF